MRRNNKNNQDNHSILSSSLFQLCNEQSSGTVFIMTNRNTSARFVLHKGTVSAFCFEKKQGMHALADFNKASFTHSRFMLDFALPLANEANIDDSDFLLDQLGFTDYILGRTPTKKRATPFAYAKQSLFNTGEFDYALEHFNQFA